MATVTLTQNVPTYDAVDSDTAGGASSLVLDCPTGTAAGDVMVLALSIRGDRTFDLTSDLAVWEPVIDLEGGTGERLGVFTRTATVGDLGASYTLGCSGGTSAWAGAIVNYRDVGRLAFSSFDAGDDTFPAFSGDGLGAVVADQPVLAVAIMGHRGASGITLDPPAGFTERADVCNPSGGLRVAVGVSDYEPVFGDVGTIWQGSATGGASGRVVGWLLFVGSTDFAISGMPTNPNEVTPLAIPFADGIHTLYAGWSGALLLIEANIGGSTFRLDDEVYGRLDGDGRLGPTDDGWVDLGCDFLNLSQRAGASDDDGVLSRFEAGSLQLTLRDWESKWDPINRDSPVAPDWRLGCRVRVCCTAFEMLQQHDPSTDLVGETWLTPIFTGRVESMVVSGKADEDQFVDVSVVDDVATLAASDPLEQSPVGAGDELQERVQRILDNVGSTLELTYAIGHPEWTGNGADTPYEYQATTMAQPAWTEILLSCDAGFAVPVVRGGGDLYLVPQAPNTQLYRAFEFAWDDRTGLVDVETAYNRDQLRNVVRFARPGGSEQVALDATSIAANGGRYEYSRADLPLSTDGFVSDLANRVLVRSSDPAPRMTSIGMWPQMFGANLFHNYEAWVDGVSFGSVSAPVYFSLCRFISARHNDEEILNVTEVNPRSGLEHQQLVMIRGHELRITPEEWQVRFVTTAIDSWFDVFTLSEPSDTDAEAEQSRLDRGHRVATQYA